MSYTEYNTKFSIFKVEKQHAITFVELLKLLGLEVSTEDTIENQSNIYIENSEEPIPDCLLNYDKPIIENLWGRKENEEQVKSYLSHLELSQLATFQEVIQRVISESDSYFSVTEGCYDSREGMYSRSIVILNNGIAEEVDGSEDNAERRAKELLGEKELSEELYLIKRNNTTQTYVCNAQGIRDVVEELKLPIESQEPLMEIITKLGKYVQVIELHRELLNSKINYTTINF